MTGERNEGLTTQVSDRARRHAEDNGWRYYERDMGFGRMRLGWHRYNEKGGTTLAGDGSESLMRMLDHDDRCAECGAWIEYGSMGEARLRSARLCFTCDHYRTHISEFGDRDVVLGYDDGSRRGYHIGTIGTSSKPSHCKGFGGARWRLRFLDGREVETDDLWCWSTGIPERFYDRLPVNAEIVR